MDENYQALFQRSMLTLPTVILDQAMVSMGPLASPMTTLPLRGSPDNYLYYTKRTQLIELEDYAQLIEPGESVELPDTVWPPSDLQL